MIAMNKNRLPSKMRLFFGSRIFGYSKRGVITVLFAELAIKLLPNRAFSHFKTGVVHVAELAINLLAHGLDKFLRCGWCVRPCSV